MSETLYGQTKAEWREIYDRADWRKQVVAVCSDVANCEHAACEDRELAVKILGTLVEFDQISPLLRDERTVAELTFDTQMALLAGAPANINTRLRDECSSRVRTARWVLSTAMPLIVRQDRRPEFADLPPELAKLLGGDNGSGSN